MVFQIVSGPLPGKYWYWSGEIIPNMGVGLSVAAEQTVATFAPSRTGVKSAGGRRTLAGRAARGGRQHRRAWARPPARTSGTCSSAWSEPEGWRSALLPPTVGTTVYAEP